MFGPLCWPPVARVGKHMLGAVASMCHCVGTVPCTWLHTANLFWHVDTFWRPLGHFPVTIGILAVFCHLWAAGMPTQLLGAPQGWVALKTGCICHAPNQNGHSKPNGARHGMGAKTPFSFKKGVEILSQYQSATCIFKNCKISTYRNASVAENWNHCEEISGKRKTSTSEKRM